ncbi:MAG TPA: hypothetical protein VF626_02365, partial [Chthoniobacterales bacterium]
MAIGFSQIYRPRFRIILSGLDTLHKRLHGIFSFPLQVVEKQHVTIDVRHVKTPDFSGIAPGDTLLSKSGRAALQYARAVGLIAILRQSGVR